MLVLAPWSVFWDRNYFTGVAPAVAWVVRDPFVRGAVSGVGLVSLVAGLVDLASLLAPRRQ